MDKSDNVIIKTEGEEVEETGIISSEPKSSRESCFDDPGSDIEMNTGDGDSMIKYGIQEESLSGTEVPSDVVDNNEASAEESGNVKEEDKSREEDSTLIEFESMEEDDSFIPLSRSESDANSSQEGFSDDASAGSMKNYFKLPPLSPTKWLDRLSSFFMSWEDSLDYELWQDEKFREYAENIVDEVREHCHVCLPTCLRANNRRPTVQEFWNSYISKRVPRQSWYALWKVVNPERRGWPLQYITKAKVYIHSVFFSTSFSSPLMDAVVVESMDENLKVGQKLNSKDISLWQFEPVEPGEEFFADGISIEEGQTILATVRKFYEVLYFLGDTEKIVQYIEQVFFSRLTLNYYLENKAPSEGILSSKLRGRLITAIKQYHYLRNKIQDLYVKQSLAEEENLDSEAEGVDALNAPLLALELELEQHRVRLGHLTNPQMRMLVHTINDEAQFVGAANEENSDYFLVMKNLAIEELKTVYTFVGSLNSHDKLANIRVMDDLQLALKSCNKGSTIYVVSGNYSIGSLGKLDQGGKLIGIKLRDMEVTLSPSDDIGDVWILVNTIDDDATCLQNLTFAIDEEVDAKLSSVIFLSSGHLTMENCTVRKNRVGQRDLRTEKGIVTAVGKADDAHLSLRNCDFVNFEDYEIGSGIKVIDGQELGREENLSR